MISLEEVKQYLRVDFDDDDKLLQNKIIEAEIYIDSCCGTQYKKYEDKVKIAKLLIKKIVNDLYENRGLYLEGKKTGYDRISNTILDILANCGDPDD